MLLKLSVPNLEKRFAEYLHVVLSCEIDIISYYSYACLTSLRVRKTSFQEANSNVYC